MIMQNPSLNSTLGPLQVLVADDGVVNRQLALGLLTRDGHSVRLVPNGQRAVQELRNSRFDLVLMDVEMPVMDGLTAVRTIRAHEKLSGGHTPIVALTSITDRDACFAAGVDAFLNKPLQMRSLREVLQSLLEKKAA